MSRIFLSYRRQDQPHAAARIYDNLVDRFGAEAVFKDLDSLPPGQDFRRVLERALERCEATLVVIGPSWLDLKLADGTRRLDHPADFVRLEIERSLARDIPVIPVLLDLTLDTALVEVQTLDLMYDSTSLVGTIFSPFQRRQNTFMKQPLPVLSFQIGRTESWLGT